MKDKVLIVHRSQSRGLLASRGTQRKLIKSGMLKGIEAFEKDRGMSEHSLQIRTLNAEP